MTKYKISLTISVDKAYNYVGVEVEDPLGINKYSLPVDQIHTRLQELMNNRLLILSRQIERTMKGTT